MHRSLIFAGAACAALFASTALAQSDGDDLDQRTRELGRSVAAAFLCTEEDGREEFKGLSQSIFDLIVQDVGTDRGFLYAVSLGYGAAAKADALDCAKALESWALILDHFELAGDDE